MRRRVITGVILAVLLFVTASLAEGWPLRWGLAVCFTMCWLEMSSAIQKGLRYGSMAHLPYILQRACLIVAANLLVYAPIEVTEILALAVAAFSYDIGGFFVGKKFGKITMQERYQALVEGNSHGMLRKNPPRKTAMTVLAEGDPCGMLCRVVSVLSKVSPKKTLEGYVGGLAASFVATGAFVGFVMKFSPISLTIGLWLFGGTVACLGDLLGSATKRWLNVKDSDEGVVRRLPGLRVLEKLMAGHGGFLDRFDSFCLVVFFYYWLVLYGLPGEQAKVGALLLMWVALAGVPFLWNMTKRD